jgi:hypothetical protein
MEEADLLLLLDESPRLEFLFVSFVDSDGKKQLVNDTVTPSFMSDGRCYDANRLNHVPILLDELGIPDGSQMFVALKPVPDKQAPEVEATRKTFIYRSGCGQTAIYTILSPTQADLRVR